MIPEEFHLAGRRWRVQLIPLGDELCGDCNTTQRIIRVNSDHELETQQDTFYHEFIHAIKFTLGWTDDDDNHAECDALGGLLLQYERTKKGQSVS